MAYDTDLDCVPAWLMAREAPLWRVVQLCVCSYCTLLELQSIFQKPVLLFPIQVYFLDSIKKNLCIPVNLKCLYSNTKIFKLTVYKCQEYIFRNRYRGSDNCYFWHYHQINSLYALKDIKHMNNLVIKKQEILIA